MTMKTEKKGIGKRRRETLRRLLRDERKKLVVDIEKQIGRELDERITPRLDSALDEGDWSTLNMGDSVDYSILEMRYKTFKDIGDAFPRLEAGTYGVCESCSAEIPLARLKAEPFARYCVPCLNQMEAVERAEGRGHSIPPTRTKRGATPPR
jgi:DnaK suppressor protein